MKKLMTMIGALAAAFGLYAADVSLDASYISFESDYPGCGDGQTLDVTQPTDDGDYFWISELEEAPAIAAFEDGEAAKLPYGPTGRRQEFTDTGIANANYLKLDTGKESLFRTLVDCGEQHTAVPVDVSAGPVFIDTLVKFTAFEDEQTFTAEDGTKIAVWMKATEGDEGGETNLYISAGCDASGEAFFQAKNIKLDGAYEADTWYRLTVKSVGSIFDPAILGDVPAGDRLGFVVYINGALVSTEEALFDLSVGYLNATAQALATEGQLFPSITAGLTLSGVGFKGMGSIDDLYTGAGEPFPPDVVGFSFKEVEGLKVAEVKTKDGTVLEAPYMVAPGTTVTVTYAADGNYIINPTTVDYTIEEATEIDPAKDVEVKAAAAKIGAVLYLTLKDAVDAVGENETIELLADCASVGISVPSGKAFTIDFAGKKVTFNKPGAGSKNTQTQAFQLLQGSTIVFKNGTICCSAENKDMTWVKTDAEKGIAMIIQSYANLTLEGMTIDGANIAKNGSTAARYLISNNSGNVVFEDTIITANEGDIAFDTCKYNTYTLPTVEVKGTSAITGDVELSGGNLTLTAGELNGELIDAGIGDGVITKADDFEADAPAGYKWVNGVLTACDYVAQIGDDKYESLAAAVAAADGTADVVLLKDCSGAGVALWAKDQKSITIDLGGFTYTCVEPPVGSSGTQNQAFHFEQGNTVVIKNGTLTTVQGSAAFRFVIQNYADLTLDGVTVDGSKLAITGRARYTLSNNCGTVALGNGTALIASTVADGQDAFAMDTCKYASYALPTVTINGVTITGDIELGGGNLTLTAGTLNGALVDGGIGEGVITKADGFTAAAPAGYKWDEDGKLVKDEGEEIKPGDIAVVEAKDEEEALSKVTIKPINDEAEAAGQAAVIKGKATQDGETGKWTVEPVIDEDAEAFKAPEVAVETTLDQIVAGTDGAEVTVELPAAKVTPGLYYSVDVATELVGNGSTFVESERVLATEAGVSLKVTKPTGGKAFFKVSEHMAPTPAN